MTPTRKINYLEALWRRKWLILPFVLLGVAGGLAAFTQMTPLYRTGAVITYVPQSLSSSVMPDPAESRRTPPNRVREMRGYIVQTDFMHRVAAELGMEDPPRDELEELLGRFEIIKLDMENYRFAYIHHDPVRAADISNIFADLFIEAYHEEKLGKTRTSISFVEDEIARLEAQLGSVQRRLVEYRERHKGALPSDRATNQAEVTFLRGAIADLDREIERVTKERDQRLEMLRTNRADIGSSASLGTQDPRVTQLATLRQQLADAQLRYTDSHPEVVRLKANIQALVKRIQSEPFTALEPAPSAAPGDGTETDGKTDGFRAYIESEIKALNARLAELQAERSEAKSRMTELGKLIDLSLTHEAEIQKLNNEIQVMNNRLTQKQNQMQSLQSELEAVDRAVYEHYEIRAPAGVPILPFRPDIFQLLLMGLLGGLAVGVGLAFLRELSDKRIYSPDEIENLLDVEIMASIERFRAKRWGKPARRATGKRAAHG